MANSRNKAQSPLHDGTAYKEATAKQYDQLVKNIAPKPPYFLNCLKAFLVGGFICLIAQFIMWAITTFFDLSLKEAGAPTSAIMIIIAIILTCFGVYDKIAQFAGAGTAVPITGFANCMSSAAIEYRSEGFVLGVGGNMFKVAGPVIVFGSVAAFLAAIIKILITNILGGLL
jgi:stage V sporulation protein AC